MVVRSASNYWTRTDPNWHDRCWQWRATMTSFDLFLIDRVFQPLVDRGARWGSCFGSARIAFIVAALTQVLSYQYGGGSSWTNLIMQGAMVAIVGFILLMNLHHIKRFEVVTRPGRLNPARVEFFFTRVIYLLFGSLALGASLSALVAHAGDGYAIIRYISGVLCWSSYIGGAYLTSCTPMPPPPPKPARVPAGAAFQGI